MSAKLITVKSFSTGDYHDRVRDLADKARNVSWGIWFGGVPVSLDMYKYMSALNEALPHVKFFPKGSGVYNGTTWVVQKFYAVMDGFPFTLGHVGHADVSVSRSSSKRSFYVYSRNIANNKYAAHRDQFFTSASDEIAKVVRKAKKHLTPFSNEELIRHTQDDVRDKVVSSLNRGSEKAMELCHQYGIGYRRVDRKFMEEMKHLKDMGTEFVTDYFNKAMDKIDEAYAEWVERKNYAPAMTFVRIEPGQYPTAHVVVDNTNIRDNYIFSKGVEDAPKAVYKLDELPERIAGQVAVLSIIEDRQYVESVGYKVDNNIFWLERDLNETPYAQP